MRLRSVRLLALLLSISGALLTASCGHLMDLRTQVDDDSADIDERAGDTWGSECKPQSMMCFAHDLDCLERHIEQNGSVVIKVPDVWGQARLTKYRDEFENVMVGDLNGFYNALQGRTSLDDQAYFSTAVALSAAISGPAAVIQGPTNGAAPSAANQTVLLPADLSAATKGVGNATTATIPATVANNSDLGSAAPAAFLPARRSTGANFIGANVDASGNPVSLNIRIEPSEYLAQKARYLNCLQQIRRINEGDDTADSPGYSLNLVRVPVSLLPGKKTSRGYGAEVTMTLTPVLGDELLPTTFRNLVINDVVDQVGFPLVAFLNDPDAVRDYLSYPETTHEEIEKNRAASPEIVASSAKPSSLPSPSLIETVANRNRVVEPIALPENAPAAVRKPLTAPERKVFLAKLKNNTKILAPVVSSSKQRNAMLAFPPSQIFDIYGYDFAFHLADDAHQTLKNDPANKHFVHLPDLQGYLREELFAAHKFLTTEANHDLWDFCNADLAQLIHTCQLDEIQVRRDTFRKLVEARIAKRYEHAEWAPNQQAPYQVVHSTTAALAWAIIVESALLNDHLVQDMKETASAKGCVLCADWKPYYLPCPPPDARQAFNDYVRCRWPIHVFALDPENEEQNIADSFTRRRETQLALSLAFVSGNVSARSFSRYARRIEAEYDTIALNRTIVGFSHGEETFGWRFTPRFQTPPLDSNLKTLTQDLLIGPPSRESELRKRKLEPGIRECVAIVIMPSFVPYLTCDVTSNWFDLANPKHKQMDSVDAMRLSRSAKSILTCSAEVKDACQFRDGDLMRLQRKAQQLEARLPLQTQMLQVPYENTLGGFQMFSNGITDLAPELLGWYGAPGLWRGQSTDLFLVGKHYNIKQTRVIAGGNQVPTSNQELLSRELIKVTIPGNAQTIKGKDGKDFVDVDLATPYGVTHHLLIPVVTQPTTASPTGVVWSPNSSFSADVTYDAKGKVTAKAPSAGSPANVTLIDYNERASFFAPGNSLTLKLKVKRTTDKSILADKQVTLTLNADVRKVSPTAQQILDLIAVDDVPAGEKLARIELSGVVTGPANTDIGIAIDNPLIINCK